MSDAMSDAELVEFAAVHGMRGVYQAGYDLAIDQMRGQQDQDREFIETIHKALREMGFRSLGMSREQEILHALTAVARQRAAGGGGG
ncbi:hypothetical protein J2Y46_002582 [Microbacterium sp. BE35]|uniref:hypothetical protein n=1 Tax=Microbacterium sp. BE35 TaxID=2817773 RepID=UPI002857301C|nr:hypothetical protein [Microbacterium sp. BE35]MDR7189756.1 hypothetical protein [Microbacterium sp. BE35]